MAGGGDHGIQAALRFKVGATEHVCLLMVRTQHRERERERLAMGKEEKEMLDRHSLHAFLREGCQINC